MGNSTSNDEASKFRELENQAIEQTYTESARKVLDLSGYKWQMEEMMPGQGVREGFHKLVAESCGNICSWTSALVPGDVYSDLYNAGAIEDPYFGRNFMKCRWVQKSEWWYVHLFSITEEMKDKNYTLVFEGIDYSFDAWLNNVHLGHHEGMMSSHKVDVTSIIVQEIPRRPNNILMIKIDPPPRNQMNFAGLKHNFAGDYLTGISSIGIWKPIKVIATDKLRMDNYRLESKVVGSDAHVEIDVDIVNLVNKKHDVQVSVELCDIEGNRYTAESQAVINDAQNKVSLELDIQDAKLWWPYELGEPHRYDLTIKVSEINTDIVLDELNEKVGIREIQLEMNPGFTEEEAELPWTFVVNGKKMFLRSACWGGQPSFLYGRNSKDRYRYFLEKAKECNINNLRIFGWHPAETEEFYDLCDELGITVWTNYAFATLVLRDDQEYVDKVCYEIAEIVKDRRNHASTVMWMGGEEVYFADAHVESNNKKLMQTIGDVTRLHTNVPYADASPLSSREGIRLGYKPKESMHANSHCYAAGLVFMEDYYPKIDCCIVPELTAFSAPNVESLEQFIPEDELWPCGYSWGYHGGNMHALEILNYEVHGDTCMDSLEHFVEATQIAQGVIFQYALEHFRRQKPHVSGVSLCHFITHMPLIKWEIIDYYGVEKVSFSYVKKSYQPLLSSMEFPKRR